MASGGGGPLAYGKGSFVAKSPPPPSLPRPLCGKGGAGGRPPMYLFRPFVGEEYVADRLTKHEWFTFAAAVCCCVPCPLVRRLVFNRLIVVVVVVVVVSR